MVRKFQDEGRFKPPHPGSTQINNNNHNHVKIEIDKPECCCTHQCPCESEELIKNGGFEMLSADQTQVFAHWRAVNPISNTTVNQGPADTPPVAYEGIRSAWFITETSELEQHSISLQQNVTVTPGCIYQFSFAENFLGGPGGPEFERSLTGRVYYTDSAGSQFDLINISIAKANLPINTDKGFTFHQKTANMPVPCDVSKVTVQFDFFVQDTGGTRWLVDGASLRALSSASSCSKDRCDSSMGICSWGNLVRNGDFEDITQLKGSPLLYWRQLPESGNQATVRSSSSADYEGLFQALFLSSETGDAVPKSVSLRQIVTVTPGSILEFSFGENFLTRGGSAGNTPRLIGRVFWINDSGSEFDLINIPIAKTEDENDVDKGFSFHKRTAEVPVPSNVSNVYVQFDFSVTDTGNTQWILDAVQLRALPWAPSCCQDFKGVTEYA